AKAKAESASVKTYPPWQVPWPCSMASVTLMRTVAVPGANAAISIPSSCEARSRAYSSLMEPSARKRKMPQQRRSPVPAFAVVACHLVEHSQHPRRAHGVRPLQRANRIIHPFAHGEVQVRGIGHSVMHRVGG